MFFKLDFDESKFKDRLEQVALGKLKKATRRGMHRTMMAVKGGAVPKAPAVTGNLRKSIHVRTEGEGFDVIGRIFATASYARFVHNGTGLFGPLKRAFAPHFYPKFVNGKFVGMGYASGKGQKAQPFFIETIESLRPQLPAVFREGVKEEMR